ncbi:MAG: stage III sporulation protein AD [Sarcina sp.]
MDILKLIGIAVVSTVACIIVRRDRPEIANFIAIVTGVIILFNVIFKINFVIEGIRDLSDMVGIPTMYITLIIKLIGLTYLMEFAIQLCKDCGESMIASKLEFAGKILIMTMSFPILLSIVKAIMNIIPS